MNWIWNGEELVEVPPGAFGFVYIIERLTDGKAYIGCKQFNKTLTKAPLKGKTRKRKVTSESDWRTYFGSNEELTASVRSLGKEHFTRTVLHLCKTAGELHYIEAKEIFARDAILSNSYFNGWVNIRIGAAQLDRLRFEAHLGGS